MTIKQIKVGSFGPFQYDDSIDDGAIVTDGQLIVTEAPTDPNHAIRLSDVGGTAGDVSGPASAVDNAVCRFNTTTGKLIQNSVVTISDAGVVTVNANAVALQAPPAGTLLHIGQLDATTNYTLLDAYGNVPYLTFRRAQGTAAAPTTMNAAGQLLAQIEARGRYDGSNYSGVVAAIKIFTGAAYTSGNTSSYITFSTTPTGSTTLYERLRIDPNGLVGIGTSVPDSILTINANASTLPAPVTGAGTLLHLGQVDAVPVSAGFDGFGEGLVIYGRRANGTCASKTNVLNEQGIAHLLGIGYGTSAYSSYVGGISVIASEDFTDTAQGTYVQIRATPIGSTTLTEVARFATAAITLLDGASIILGSTSGNKIGSAVSQKLGFYGVTPVDQPATVADADGSLADATTKINAIIDRLQELGLIA